MDGMRVVVPVHFHGTMAANGTFRWKTPCALTLTHVSLASSVDTNAQVKIGNTGTNGDDDYMALKDVGDQTAAEYGRADFVDGEYPHIPGGHGAAGHGRLRRVERHGRAELLGGDDLRGRIRRFCHELHE